MSARHRSIRRLPLAAAGLMAVVALLGLGEADAAGPITVNFFQVGTGTDNECSLSEALQAARDNSEVGGCRAGTGDDTIRFARAGTVYAPTDGFKVDSNATIVGHPGGTTINGGGGVDVVLTEASSGSVAKATEVTLTDLTVGGATGPAEAGVTIIDEGDAELETEFTVTLDKLDLNGNFQGVAFDNVGNRQHHSGRRGTVTIRNSVIRANPSGGANVTACSKTPGAVTIEVVNSVVHSNGSSDHSGIGGIHNICGHLRVVGSTIHGNRGKFVGGIAASPLRSSGAQAFRSTGTQTEIINSTITNNTAYTGVFWGRYSPGGVSVRHSPDSPGSSSVKILNSTITENTGAVNTVCKIGASGRVCAPAVEGDPVGGFEAVATSDLTKGTKVAVEIRNSVIGGNSGQQCYLDTIADQSLTRTANASSDETCGFGLVIVDAGLAGVVNNSDDIDGAVPIGPGGNSGNVPTMAIGVGSPLFGAADIDTCQDRDARGVVRPQGARCDIGAYELVAVEVGDLVWKDTNGDGDQDAGEPGIAGVTLRLTGGEGVSRTATTDANGGYSFDVTPGRWTVGVTDTGGVLAGHRAPAKTSIAANVTVGGAKSLGFDFGYKPGSLGDLVWVDADRDGVKDSTESGLQGVEVRLHQGESVTSASTDANGAYSFKGLAAGDYVIEFALPAKYRFTSRNSGDDDGLDSDADQSSGRTGTISLAAGEDDLSWDAGLVPLRESGPPIRYAGSDRYGTAVDISKETFHPGVDVAYVATGENFPDALAASAASGGRGPVLLVTKTAISGGVVAELKRLKPKKIVVLGGTGAVSADVESALSEHTSGKVNRQGGADRYNTAAAVSANHFEPGVPVAFVATGEDFPDALTGGPASAMLGGPILLARKDKLPTATADALKRLKPKRIVVLGGTGVVSAEVEVELSEYTPGKVTRLAGADRYRTAEAISKAVFKPGVPVVFVATGLNFPDALAGAAAGAFEDGPVLLVAGSRIPPATANELKRLKPKRVMVLGGTAAVPKSVETALAAYAR